MSCQLPDEILLMIQDHLFWPRQPNLLLVSRRFYQLFLPRLYGSVNLEWADISKKVIPFVRAALRNPEITRSIRDLDLPQIDTWNDKDAPTEDITEVHHLICEASHSPEEQQKWEDDLQRGSIDAWVSLLFLKLENLQGLTIALSAKPEHLHRILDRAAKSEKPFDSFPILQHLEDLSIGSRDLRYPFHTDEALPFFQFPSLRTFRAIEALETFHSDETPKEAPQELLGSSSVTTLKLSQSNGKFGMRALITSCANLETFEYQHQNLFAKGEFGEDFVPSAFYRPLLTQKHSLTTLRFNDQHDDPPYELAAQSSGPNQGVGGSFAEFTALKDLRIRLPNLVGREWQTELSDLLPCSLEKLYLAHCWDRKFDQLVPQLRTMVSRREQQFPSLREICVEPYCLELMSREEFNAPRPPNFNMEAPRMREEDVMKFDVLRGECEQAGIAFTIQTPHFMKTMRDFVRGL
ncbi:hypothetical protein FE257_005875 [Aspergillus nanangensis]|uniref:Leucine-rich repeat domain-containing protein n=1 Tax=Aspergillus nanangensis TaxID=2582783 RepID=A0AAD4GVA0_ASPNN|nr:hypothetical protein FE257_005875 [Aspergillus nanangensis]